MTAFSEISRTLASDRQSLRESLDVKTYPSWMAGVLPLFNLIRRLFRYETLVNFSSPSLDGRNIVLLKSDAVRLDASIKKQEKIDAVFQKAVNYRLNFQERKDAVETLTDSEDLELKTSLLDSLTQAEERMKRDALNEKVDLRQRYAYANLLSDPTRLSVRQEITFDVAKANALDDQLNISQRLANLRTCRESDRKAVEAKIRQDERLFEEVALNKALPTKTRQSSALKLPQERQTELLKIIYNDHFSAIALDNRQPLAERLKAADKLTGEAKNTALRCIAWDKSAAAVVQERKRRFPKVDPKPKILNQEEMAQRNKMKIIKAKQEFALSVARIKTTVLAQKTAIENLGITPVHARICPKVFLRLREEF